MKRRDFFLFEAVHIRGLNIWTGARSCWDCGGLTLHCPAEGGFFLEYPDSEGNCVFYPRSDAEARARRFHI